MRDSRNQIVLEVVPTGGEPLQHAPKDLAYFLSSARKAKTPG
jgi:hypothetical protein